MAEDTPIGRSAEDIIERLLSPDSLWRCDSLKWDNNFIYHDQQFFYASNFHENEDSCGYTFPPSEGETLHGWMVVGVKAESDDYRNEVAFNLLLTKEASEDDDSDSDSETGESATEIEE